MSGNEKLVFGVDVGATGIKCGFVDLDKGILTDEKYKTGTPNPSTPEAVAKVIKEMMEIHNWTDRKIGVGFPSVVRNGTCLTASNIHPSWIGVNAEQVFEEICGVPFTVINDADAAGLAVLLYGSAKGQKGTSIMLTIGTGIGSALLVDGKLVPNTEFGHMEFKGDIAENWVSNRARKERELEYDEWGKELNDYLLYLNDIFSPDKIVLGGGVSKRFELYSHCFDKKLSVINSRLFNDAGIIGAAVAAWPELVPHAFPDNSV